MKPVDTVQTGQIIAGKYRVERVLGRGGMGVVLLAMHDALDQRVAIKIMHPEAAAEQEWVARFQREARMAAKIKSEHVVRVFDVGRLDNGAPYMVMEYLEGKDLQDILNEKKRLSIEETARYILQVSEALAEAHALGIVHRDLKPANLFVAKRSDGSPCAKILDFGISKVGSSLTGEVTMTSTSAIVGSPLYMSPEQMKASKNVDRRADIWSLGIILQELSTGLPSFVANTTAELCALVLTALPTPVRETLPGAPAPFEALVRKCLQRDPKDRFQSVGELAHALAEFVPNSTDAIDRIDRIARKGEFGQQSTEPKPFVVVSSPDSVAQSLDRTVLSSSAAEPAVPRLAPQSMAQSAPSPPTATNAAWGGRSGEPVALKSKTLIFAGAGGLAAFAILAVLIAHALSTTTTPTAEPANMSATVSVSATKVVTTSTSTTTTTTTASAISVPVTSLPMANTSAVLVVKDAGVPAIKPTGTKPHTAPVDTSGFGGRN